MLKLRGTSLAGWLVLLIAVAVGAHLPARLMAEPAARTPELRRASVEIQSVFGAALDGLDVVRAPVRQHSPADATFETGVVVGGSRVLRLVEPRVASQAPRRVRVSLVGTVELRV